MIRMLHFRLQASAFRWNGALRQDFHLDLAYISLVLSLRLDSNIPFVRRFQDRQQIVSQTIFFADCSDHESGAA